MTLCQWRNRSHSAVDELCQRRIYARWQVSLWQDGFIYEKKQIRQVFRWNQIENVQRMGSGPAKIVHGCNVCRQDGYEVELAVFSDLPEFIDVVLEESARQLAPQGLCIVPPRSNITFTALKLDRQGISSPGVIPDSPRPGSVTSHDVLCMFYRFPSTTFLFH